MISLHEVNVNTELTYKLHGRINSHFLRLPLPVMHDNLRAARHRVVKQSSGSYLPADSYPFLGLNLPHLMTLLILRYGYLAIILKSSGGDEFLQYRLLSFYCHGPYEGG
jgi:hypothetical protein